MAIVKGGKIINTEEDNRIVESYLAKHKTNEVVTTEDGKEFDLYDFPQMSDYKWQMMALQDRIDHPERYAKFEDVEKTIKRIRQWLAEHDSQR